MRMKKILFVCIHNSGRSQIAEAIFNRQAFGEYIALSAGTQPAKKINPTVRKVMQEIGIEIGGQRPKQLTPDMLEGVYRVITMGCGIEETCPASFITTEDWDLDDPENKSLREVRQIRDQIKTKVAALLKELNNM